MTGSDWLRKVYICDIDYEKAFIYLFTYLFIYENVYHIRVHKKIEK